MERSHVGRKSTTHLTDNSQSLKCLNVIGRSMRTESDFEMSGFILLQCQNLKASTIQFKDPVEVDWLRKFKVYLNCKEKQNNSKTTTTKTISKTQPEKTRFYWETSGRSRDRSELLKGNKCSFLFLFICMYIGILFFSYRFLHSWFQERYKNIASTETALQKSQRDKREPKMMARKTTPQMLTYCSS